MIRSGGPTRPAQFAYDNEFLYLAFANAKADSVVYVGDPQPRTYDADLSQHDHLRIRLDLDRDYATYYELAVDHRGWTADRCWLDASWNLKWFVAAGGDDAHWTVEAAIPWKSLTTNPPTSGDAWAIAWERVLPKSATSPAAETPPSVVNFHLLLFQ